jgi:hypothetical protein
MARAFSLAVSGEHMIRYTAEDVLPRLQLAIEQVRSERESKRQAAAQLEPVGKLRATRRAGPRSAVRVGEDVGVSEFVGGTRETESVVASA